MKEYNVKETFFKKVTKVGFSNEEKRYIDQNRVMYLLPESDCRENRINPDGPTKVFVYLLDDDDDDKVRYELSYIKTTPDTEIGSKLSSEFEGYEYDPSKASVFLDELKPYSILTWGTDHRYIYMGDGMFYNLRVKVEHNMPVYSDSTIIERVKTTISDIIEEVYSSEIKVYEPSDLKTSNHCINHTRPKYPGHISFTDGDVRFEYVTLEDEEGLDLRFAVYKNDIYIGNIRTNSFASKGIRKRLWESMKNHEIDKTCVFWSDFYNGGYLNPYIINGELCLAYIPDSRDNRPWVFYTSKPEYGFVKINPADTVNWEIETIDFDFDYD